VPKACSSLDRGLALAESARDAPMQLLLLHWLWRRLVSSADYLRAQELSSRFTAVARQIDDPLAEAIAHAVVASTSVFVGAPREALAHAQIAMATRVHSSLLSAANFGYHNTVGVRNTLGVCLWMLGFPDQALEKSREITQAALELGDPLVIAYVCSMNAAVHFWTGDWPTAEELVGRLNALKYHSSYTNPAMGWQGCLEVLRGDLAQGIQLLQTGLENSRATGRVMYSAQFACVLSEALARAGQPELAYATVREWSDRCESHGSLCDVVELQRVKGEILIGRSPADAAEGEACLLSSLQLAERQSALSLELRAGMSLARYYAAQGFVEKALQLLAPLLSRFTEGFETQDLIAADNLMAELRARS
jgi:hypothetical protein